MNNVSQILGKMGKNDNKPEEVQAQTYRDMMGTYDTLEKIVFCFEKFGPVADPYVKHLQKLIDIVEKNNEVMLNNFFKYMESGRPLSGVEKLKIEKSINDSKIAMQQFLIKIN